MQTYPTQEWLATFLSMRIGWISENLEMGNSHPLIHILQPRYSQKSYHLSQNTKITELEHFTCSAHNYNFIQFKTYSILYLAHFWHSKYCVNTFVIQSSHWSWETTKSHVVNTHQR